MYFPLLKKVLACQEKPMLFFHKNDELITHFSLKLLFRLNRKLQFPKKISFNFSLLKKTRYHNMPLTTYLKQEKTESQFIFTDGSKKAKRIIFRLLLRPQIILRHRWRKRSLYFSVVI